VHADNNLVKIVTSSQILVLNLKNGGSLLPELFNTTLSGNLSVLLLAEG